MPQEPQPDVTGVTVFPVNALQELTSWFLAVVNANLLVIIAVMGFGIAVSFVVIMFNRAVNDTRDTAEDRRRDEYARSEGFENYKEMERWG